MFNAKLMVALGLSASMLLPNPQEVGVGCVLDTPKVCNHTDLSIDKEVKKVAKHGYKVYQKKCKEEEKRKAEEEAKKKALEEERRNIVEEDFVVTAYCSCSHCSDDWGTNTASGKKATQGRTIAVDTSKIPLGTEVEINGHTYIAEDVGGKIKGNRIDVYFNSHSEALDFGKQYLTVKYKKK